MLNLRAVCCVLWLASAGIAAPSTTDVALLVRDASLQLAATIEGKTTRDKAITAAVAAELAADELIASVRKTTERDLTVQSNASLTSAFLLRSSAALITTALIAYAGGDRDTLNACIAGMNTIADTLTKLIPAMQGR